jgi:hypothetical protein
MPNEPQLPDFLDSHKLITVNTQWHSVEIAKGEYEKVLTFCKDNHITQDYYMWEFMTWEHES